jgi:circadian clock protein KaiB
MKKNGVDDPVTDLPHYELHLFITGAAPNSVRAIANLHNICEQHLQGRYTIKVIDLYENADLASKEQIIALPMLMKKQPLPERKLIGDLSQTEKVLRILDIPG